LSEQYQIYKDSDNERALASMWAMRFKDAMVAKADYTKRWQTYMDAYNGDYFVNESLPDYRSDLVSNYIFSVIETIKPIMLESKAKFCAIGRQAEGLAYSNDVQEALSYEWDREHMSRKLIREAVNLLVLGNAVFFIPWDEQGKNVRGVAVNPFNIFPDPLATCVDDAEYIIYASYKNVNRLKHKFPKKAKFLSPGQINYSELVNDNDKLATRIDNQVLVLEVWTKDYDTFEEMKFGKVKLLYPNGRRLIIAPELGVVLSDKPNPYADGKLPFEVWKDYDIPGKFWGEGEVKQLLSPQKHMNDLNNAILDNAKATANMPWIIDKNAGIPQGAITARPGLIIRKNPGSDIRREQPPQMPTFIPNAVEIYKNDIEIISGIFDTIKGNSATGVYTAQGILALQDAGTTRIKIKVQLLEDSLARIGNMWWSRMKQYWKDDRWINITKHNGEYDLKKFNARSLEFDYDIKISAGSTMSINRGAMLDLMIRLAQTQMPDGQTLVDREAVAEFLPQEVKAALLKRMEGGNQNFAQLQQAVEQLAQGFQQFVQQDQQDDQKTMQAIEQIASTVEQLNEQIIQLKEKHDILEREKEEEERINQIKSDSYNAGYIDAEQLAQQSVPDVLGSDDEEEDDYIGGLPEELLTGLEGMTDDQMALLMEQNPELIEMLNSQMTL
jgi:hypothetical protein